MKIKKIDSSCIRAGLTFRPDINGFEMLRCVYNSTEGITAASIKEPSKLYHIKAGTPCCIYIDVKEGDIL